MHYAMADGGGVSPNVVQPHAAVLYHGARPQGAGQPWNGARRARRPTSPRGAALMTGTSVEKDLRRRSCANTVHQFASMEQLPARESPGSPPARRIIDAADAEFALCRRASRPRHEPGTLRSPRPGRVSSGRGIAAGRQGPAGRRLHQGSAARAASCPTCPTGDAFMGRLHRRGRRVSWLTPAAQIHTACFPSGAPGHSWQNVSIGKTSVGHKGLLLAGKVLAMTAADLFEHPEIIDQAKKEFAQRAAGRLHLPYSRRRGSHCHRAVIFQKNPADVPAFRNVRRFLFTC